MNQLEIDAMEFPEKARNRMLGEIGEGILNFMFLFQQYALNRLNIKFSEISREQANNLLSAGKRVEQSFLQRKTLEGITEEEHILETKCALPGLHLNFYHELRKGFSAEYKKLGYENYHINTFVDDCVKNFLNERLVGFVILKFDELKKERKYFHEQTRRKYFKEKNGKEVNVVGVEYFLKK